MPPRLAVSEQEVSSHLNSGKKSRVPGWDAKNSLTSSSSGERATEETDITN